MKIKGLEGWTLTALETSVMTLILTLFVFNALHQNI
jgi:hypothetical protein